MWFLLAAALAALSFQRYLAIALLFVTMGIAYVQQVLTPFSLAFLLLLALLAFLHWKFRTIRTVATVGEVLLVIAAIALFLHLIPGFHNVKALDKVLVGPHSPPFSMYFNVDKALIPFVLLAALPSLFVVKVPTCQPVWRWILLILSIPALLFLAVALGGLRIELHHPQWLWQFILANLFFVSLAEEALFRGYLQQRLSRWLGSIPALIATAAIFGLAHMAGGVLMVIFAGLSGIIYGVAWMWSGRLWVATLFHFALNLTHLLLFTYPVYQR